MNTFQILSFNTEVIYCEGLYNNWKDLTVIHTQPLKVPEACQKCAKMLLVLYWWVLSFWLLKSGLQLGFVPLFTTLWSWLFSQFQSTLLLIQPTHQQLVWDSSGWQCQRPCWRPGRQYLLLSPHPSGCSFHHRSSSGWSSLTSLWWNDADCFCFSVLCVPGNGFQP